MAVNSMSAKFSAAELEAANFAPQSVEWFDVEVGCAEQAEHWLPAAADKATRRQSCGGCPMMRSAIVLGLLIVFGATSFSMAQQAKKSGPNGEACVSEGTQRRDGKDQDGNTVNCLWDTCTYCDQSGGQINCSIQKTSFSNPRDCRAAMTRPGAGTVLPETGGLLDAGPRSPPSRRPPVAQPGGAIQKLQQQ
jgi:hypothetical protein